MACRLEMNTTYIASLDGEGVRHKKAIVCPKRERCKGKCSFDDDNFRTIDIYQGLIVKPPTQTEKLMGRIEKFFEIKGSLVSRRA